MEVIKANILEQRILDLEYQVAFQEKALNDLDNIVTDQQQQIERLNFQLKWLIQQVTTKISPSSASNNDPVHERPPHY